MRNRLFEIVVVLLFKWKFTLTILCVWALRCLSFVNSNNLISLSAKWSKRQGKHPNKGTRNHENSKRISASFEFKTIVILVFSAYICLLYCKFKQSGYNTQIWIDLFVFFLILSPCRYCGQPLTLVFFIVSSSSSSLPFNANALMLCLFLRFSWELWSSWHLWR